LILILMMVMLLLLLLLLLLLVLVVLLLLLLLLLLLVLLLGVPGKQPLVRPIIRLMPREVLVHLLHRIQLTRPKVLRFLRLDGLERLLLVVPEEVAEFVSGHRRGAHVADTEAAASAAATVTAAAYATATAARHGVDGQNVRGVDGQNSQSYRS